MKHRELQKKARAAKIKEARQNNNSDETLLEAVIAEAEAAQQELVKKQRAEDRLFNPDDFSILETAIAEAKAAQQELVQGQRAGDQILTGDLEQ